MSSPSRTQTPASPDRTFLTTSSQDEPEREPHIVGTQSTENSRSRTGSFDGVLTESSESNKDARYFHVNTDNSRTNVIKVKPKRPISYPCGPESNPDLPIFKTEKRNSDPPKPVTAAKCTKLQVKPFTKESLERLERKTVQLVREYGFQPKRKLSVEDGSRLPAKYEPFPSNLYGRPLEEIDNFIYDEVNFFFIYTMQTLNCVQENFYSN